MTETENHQSDRKQLPDSVTRFLAEQGIGYRVLRRRDLGRRPRVEAILLGDELGQLPVFVPTDRLLDLALAGKVTGRTLTALAPDVRSAKTDALGVSVLPALGGLLGKELLIDRAVPGKGEVIVRGGNRSTWLAVDAEALVRAAGHVRHEAVSVPAPNPMVAPDSEYMDLDVDAIEMSVERFTTKRIRQRLEETLEIPPLPDTAQRIVKLRVDPDADISRLSSIVEKDPSLAAQVISWASSSYYSAPGSIKSVQDAMVRVLGYDLVMNLALGLALGHRMDYPEDAPRGFTPYWQEAMYTAELVAELHSRIPREYQPSFGLAYLGGLLHNFGFLILAYVFKPQFSTCCRLWEANPHLPPQAVEQHVLGVDRDQIAASLLASWHVPEEVCRAIRFGRHGDYLGRHSDYVHLVYLARSLLRRSGMVEGTDPEINQNVLSYLHLSAADAREAVQTVFSSREDLDALARGMARAA